MDINNVINDRLNSLHAERQALEESKTQLEEALESVTLRTHQIQGAIEELRSLVAVMEWKDQQPTSPSSQV